jgi:hypothetical protein
MATVIINTASTLHQHCIINTGSSSTLARPPDAPLRKLPERGTGHEVRFRENG